MKSVVIFLIMMIAGVIPAVAQATATPTPTGTNTPTATGTLILIPAFPPLPTYAATQLTPMPWATLTPVTSGQAYSPPPAPGNINIPEVGQENGFGAIGENNSRLFAKWFMEVLVSFWVYIDISTLGALDKMKLLLGVSGLSIIIIAKLRKYGGRDGKTGLVFSAADYAREKKPKKPTKKTNLVMPLIPFMLLSPVNQCSNNTPCGDVPWTLPQFPVLASPTPFPTELITVELTATPTATPGTGTPTAAPPTPTQGVDTELINNQLQTLQAFAAATPFDYAPEIPPQNITENVSQVMSFGLGLQSANLGVLQPFISIGFFGFFTWLGLRLTFMILPLITGFVGLLRKMIDLLLQFLPF